MWRCKGRSSCGGAGGQEELLEVLLVGVQVWKHFGAYIRTAGKVKGVDVQPMGFYWASRLLT